MSATTVLGPVSSEQTRTPSKRTIVIAMTIVVLFAVSFFVGRATATNHVSSVTSTAQVTRAQLSHANAALIAGDTAPLSVTGTTTQLSAANRAQIAGDTAPVTSQLSQFGQANATSCRVGRPC